MSIVSSGEKAAAVTVQAQNVLLLQGAQAEAASREQHKIQKAGKDFESILLGSWLQGAEKSFAAAPGGDDSENDGGKDQFMGMAMQQLATTLVNAGGIGIAKMITEHLQRRSSPSETASLPGSAGDKH